MRNMDKLEIGCVENTGCDAVCYDSRGGNKRVPLKVTTRKWCVSGRCHALGAPAIRKFLPTHGCHISAVEEDLSRGDACCFPRARGGSSSPGRCKVYAYSFRLYIAEARGSGCSADRAVSFYERLLGTACEGRMENIRPTRTRQVARRTGANIVNAS